MLFRLLTTIVALSILTPALGMPANAVSESQTSSAEPSSNRKVVEDKSDFRKSLEENRKDFADDAAKFDPEKIEREKEKRQTQKGGWGKKETAFMVAFAVGIAVLVVLLVKYGKECKRTSPPSCSIGVDDNCYCEEYVEPEKRGIRFGR